MMKSTDRIHLVLGLLLALLSVHGSWAGVSLRRVQETDTQQALDNAMALWDSQHVTWYKLGFSRECYCTQEYRAPYLSIVTNATIIDVVNVTDGVSISSSEALFTEAYSVERLYETIQSALERDAFEVTVEYDATFGYPLSVYIDYDDMMADEETSVVINSFLPVAPLLGKVNDAQALWNASGLASYSFTFQQLCECADEQAQPFGVQVINGTIFSVEGTVSSDGANSLIRTIPELFDYLRTQLVTTASTMTFDSNADLGYPVYVTFDTDAIVADDDISFTIVNLAETSEEDIQQLLQDGGAAPSTAPIVETNSPVTSAPSAAPIVATNSPVTSAPSAAPIVATNSPVIDAPTVSTETPPTTSSPSLTSSTKPSMTVTPTSNEILFVGSAECALNEACVGLVDDCCPTVDGKYLYCCFEEASTTRFGKEFAFIGSDGQEEKATYFQSSNEFKRGFPAPDDAGLTGVSYTRNPDQIYDLIYLKTDAITAPLDYVKGIRKFYLDVYSTAPACTQVLLQLDSFPKAEGAYPVGRHSRYVAFTSTTGVWERLEFDFLDQPDTTLDSTADFVNAMVLFFAPGTKTSDTYHFRSLDSALAGCDESTGTCEAEVPKGCSALLDGEQCTDGRDNDGDGSTDCADLGCAEDATCVAYLTASYSTASSQLAVPSGSGASSLVTVVVSITMMGMMTMSWVL